MRIDPLVAERIARLAEITGRRREAFLLLCTGLEEVQVAAEMGIAPHTVYVHLWHARKAIGRMQYRHAYLRQWYEFIMHEAMPGPKNPAPPTPVFEPDQYGNLERVRYTGAPPVTVDDRMEPFEVEV